MEDTCYRVLRWEGGFAVKPDCGTIVLAVPGVLGRQVRGAAGRRCSGPVTECLARAGPYEEVSR
ncbi:MAG TPA: hypothetical protein VIJ82_03170 [Streptosporangiaceae bacterium]|jgi:hypothetical protein